jgi:hypothetical protein
MTEMTKAWLALFNSQLEKLADHKCPIDPIVVKKCAERYYYVGMKAKHAALATADYYRLTYYREHFEKDYHDPIQSLTSPVSDSCPTDVQSSIDLLHILQKRVDDIKSFIKKVTRHLENLSTEQNQEVKTLINIGLDQPITLEDFLHWEKQQRPLSYEFDGCRCHPTWQACRLPDWSSVPSKRKFNSPPSERR